MTLAEEDDYSKIVYRVAGVEVGAWYKVIICAFGNVILELRANGKY